MTVTAIGLPCVISGDTLAEAVAAYREECDASDLIIARSKLDQRSAQTPTARTGKSRVRAWASSPVTAARTSSALCSGCSNWRGSSSLCPKSPMIEGKSDEAPLCQSSRVGPRGLLFDRSERPGCDYRRNWRLRRQVQHSAMWVTPTGEGEGFASQLAHSSRNNGPEQENSGPHSLCHSEIDKLVRVETCTSPGGSVSDEFVRRRPGPSEGVSRRSVGLTA